MAELFISKVKLPDNDTPYIIKDENALNDAAGSIAKDGKQYVRKNGEWVELAGGSGNVTDVRVNGGSILNSDGVANFNMHVDESDNNLIFDNLNV